MNQKESIVDTLIHKQYILKVGKPLVEYLYQNNEDKLALELANRLITHDDSKTSKEELEAFTKIKNLDSMKNPNVVIKENTDYLNVHWINNRHHPEHFSDYHNMSDVDILEMVCDWYARSLQYKTDFLKFVAIRQKNRFKFDKQFYDEVYSYCELISKLG